MGQSQFIAFSEREAKVFSAPVPEDPRQDNYDIWLGTIILKPCITDGRHAKLANNLYLDGHVAALDWSLATVDRYPDKQPLEQDGAFPN